MNDEPIPLPPCPACGGAYLYGLTFQHRTSCRFYEPDSATAAADHEKREGVRPLTPTEKELIQDEYDQPEEPESLGVRFRHYGVHLRHVVCRDGAGRILGLAARRSADPDGPAA